MKFRSMDWIRGLAPALVLMLTLIGCGDDGTTGAGEGGETGSETADTAGEESGDETGEGTGKETEGVDSLGPHRVWLENCPVG